MATITTNVVWADNTAQLKERMLAGIGTVDALKSSVDRTAASMGGQGLFLQANKLTAAIDQLGGVTKLTAAEQERATATLDKAIEKYKTMGMTAPPAMVALAESMKKPEDEAAKLKDALERAFTDPLGAAKSFASGIVGDVVPAMGSVGIAVGAATAVVGLAGAELMHLGAEAEAVGAQIGKMARQFNIPVQNVSDLRFAVNAAGGDFDTFGDSMFTFQKRIEDNADAVDKGLQKIGLSVAGIKDLRPDEQFLAISDAIRSSGAEVNKSAVAFEIFGKQGKEILPLLMKPLGDLADESERLGNTWSDRDVAAARAFKSEVTKLGAETEEAWTVLGRTVAPITNEVSLAWDRLKLHFANAIVLIATSGDSLLNFVGISKDWALASETAAAKQDVINKAISEGAPATIKYGEAVRFVNEQWERGKPAVEQSNDAAQAWLKKLGEGILAANIAKDADEKLTAGLAAQGIVRGEGIDAINKYTEALQKEAAAEAAMNIFNGGRTTVTAELDQSYQDLTFKVQNYGSALQFVTESARDYLHNHRDEIQEGADSWDNLTSSVNEFHDGITIAGDEIATVTIPLFSTLAREILPQATAQLQAAGEAADVSFGDRTQGMLSDVSSILSHVKGEAAQIADVVVHTGQAIMKNLADGNVWGAVVAGITGAVTLISKLFGGVSQLELEGRKVEATFEQSFGGFQGMMTAVGGAYAATGRSAAQAQADVTALMAAEKLGGDAAKAAIAKINEAFDEQKQDAADLQTAIQKYGFSIEELGPAMQKQNLDGQAKTLMNDWRLLVASGIDLVTVDQKMASSTWDYLQMAKKTGQEVPEAMKPVIQSMLDQGVFTDANGDKITEMKDLGITFSETMTQGFDKVVAKLQQLLDKMGLVPGALAAASGPINVDVNLNGHWNIPDAPDASFAAGGGLVTGHGVQHLAGGGKILAFPGAPSGIDRVPIWAAEGEGVVSRRGMASLGTAGLRSLNSGGGSQVVDFSELKAEMQATREAIQRQAALQQQAARTMPDLIASAVGRTVRRR